MSGHIVLIPYFLLMISILSLWITREKKIWFIMYLITIATFFLFKIVNAWGLIPIFFLWGACYYHQSKEKLFRILADISIFLISLGLILHIFPGVKNVEIISNEYVGSSKIPFSLSLNFKASLGFFLMAYVVSLSRRKKDWIDVVKYTAIFAPVTVFALLGSAYLPGFVQMEVKWPFFTGFWLASNLLFTCVTEEAFFRGFVQNKLVSWFSFQGGKALALCISSLFFALAHYKNGTLFMILAGVAGIFYGLSYLVSKRIEVSILTHFLLNSAHFFFFTYPM